jgi:hypothetical protein
MNMEIIRNFILFALAGGIFFLALRSLRAQRLKERYAIIFVLTGIPFLGLGFWTDGVGYIGSFLSIDYRTVSLVCITIFLILMIFKLFSIVSVQERQITILAQQVGILMQKHKIEDKPLFSNLDPQKEK